MADNVTMAGLTKNATDFLIRAIDEFRSSPKYSVINFHTAVELFLKARLLAEHWSLVVQKNADLQKFRSGDFISVSFEEACDRLAKVVDSPVPEHARKAFDRVRKHRNRMVHFFHEVDAGKERPHEEVAIEQLRAWHCLAQLLRGQWAKVFSGLELDFATIEDKLGGHRHYLTTKFDSLKEQIAALEAEGASIAPCWSCAYDAAKQETILGSLHRSTCLVCGLNHKWLQVPCPECERNIPYCDGEARCQCGSGVDADELVSTLNEFVVTSDNYLDADVPAHCRNCEGYETVILYQDHYLCTSCLHLTASLETCEWCHASSNGSMDGSYWKGCSVCDGKAGWESDRD